jgi:phage terminase large subunit-like protein
LAAQELEGELLSDVPDTLWPARLLAEANVPRAPALSKVLLAIDPAVSSHADSAETGMVVAGIADDGICYVLQDASERLSPTAIGKRVAALIALHKIDQLVVEINQGGDWLLQSLNQADLDAVITPVRAGQDKWARAEPVAMLYAQGRVKHVGRLPQLEAQMRACQRGVPNRLGMDRVDALVWAIRSLQRRKQRNFEIRTV